MAMKHHVARAVLVAAIVLAAIAPTASARTTMVLAPESKETIRGDVLWMRTVPDRALLAPFALDYRGRWCWAPAEVYEESCTVLVSRRVQGRRTLDNGSRVPVRVTYTEHF
ncbi:hypothetical protein [Conexibacter sp. CPCC 206217]|uniref:hypothetical protein n=1 Tax=Conexibacter sp. CPCC 206217 TaxID=3064574 RepID=UPI002723BDB4|nr:hypothetical protein [Conexibacter sp. CPCC 206217]MDO8208947.1 hypothetical protein [Conexibacter sp. CPCC 206217]